MVNPSARQVGAVQPQSVQAWPWYSVGIPGFRIGKDITGRKYRQVSIPGTGIYNRSYKRDSGRPMPGKPAASFGTWLVLFIVVWIVAVVAALSK